MGKLSSHQRQDEAASMGSSQEIFRSLQDLSNLALLVDTGWSDGPGGLYSLDAWVGGQFLLYYETEKFAPRHQNLKCADYTVGLEF